MKLDYYGLEHDGKYQLFNLADDPAESRNLAEQRADKVEELRTLLTRYRERARSYPPIRP